MKKKEFTGPLFVFGLPRSGTKLLRGLLAAHPMISIPDNETEFIPYWVSHWDSFGDLSEYHNFKTFYRKMIHLSYFTYMEQDGKLIEERTWYELCRNFTIADVFEGLMRHDTGISYGTKKIWGDKSPSYILHLPLLKKLFPSARFIHIIRDVRDYSLSIKKAWVKNMIRASQRWVNSIEKVRIDAQEACPNEYIELKYEDLLESPETVLKKLCSFLDLKFNNRMLILSETTESIGHLTGTKEIIRSNKEKYRDSMEPRMCRKIEAISASVLRSCKYPVEYSGESIRVSEIRMFLYQILDGYNLFRSTIKRRGLISGVGIRLRSTMMRYNSRFKK